jgi:hypothetical protein
MANFFCVKKYPIFRMFISTGGLKVITSFYAKKQFNSQKIITPFASTSY